MSEPQWNSPPGLAAAPPTFAAYEPPAPKWPGVIGVICIVFASLGLVQGVLAAAMAVLMPLIQGMVPASQQSTFAGVEEHMGLTIASAALGTGAAGALLAGGILLVKRRRRASTVLLCWAPAKILIEGFGTAVGYMVGQSQLKAMGAGGAGGVPAAVVPVVQTLQIVGIGVGLLFACALPGFVLIWFMRDKVRADMASWK